MAVDADCVFSYGRLPAFQMTLEAEQLLCHEISVGLLHHNVHVYG